MTENRRIVRWQAEQRATEIVGAIHVDVAGVRVSRRVTDLFRVPPVYLATAFLWFSPFLPFRGISKLRAASPV